MSGDRKPPTTVSRLIWFVLLWASGVATVTAVGLLIRLMLKT